MGHTVLVTISKALGRGQDLVVRAQVYSVLEHLDYGVMLELMDRLLHPVRADEINISVDPGDILPGWGQTRDSDIDEVLLEPQLRVCPDLYVTGIGGVRHLKVAISKSTLYDIQLGTILLHPFLELLEQTRAGLIPFRICHHCDDIEVL
jgi:hypothetical protein